MISKNKHSSHSAHHEAPLCLHLDLVRRASKREAPDYASLRLRRRGARRRRQRHRVMQRASWGECHRWRLRRAKGAVHLRRRGATAHHSPSPLLGQPQHLHTRPVDILRFTALRTSLSQPKTLVERYHSVFLCRSAEGTQIIALKCPSDTHSSPVSGAPRLIREKLYLLLCVAGGWLSVRITADTKPKAGSSSSSDKKASEGRAATFESSMIKPN